MHLYHPKTGRSAPLTSDRNETHNMRERGYFLARELVDTVNGHRVQISCEASVNSGRGPEQALELMRKDPGNEGKPAFMTPEAWDALGADDHRRMITGSRFGFLSPSKMDPDEKLTSAGRAEHDRLMAEISDLRRQLEDERRAGITT